MHQCIEGGARETIHARARRGDTGGTCQHQRAAKVDPWLPVAAVLALLLQTAVGSDGALPPKYRDRLGNTAINNNRRDIRLQL